MDSLMNLFGPWLVPLFGVGTVLLVGGMLAKEMASDPSVKGLGRGAANVGWRLLLLAAAMYLMILALGTVFENMIYLQSARWLAEFTTSSIVHLSYLSTSSGAA
jgi:hypothetical protein